MHSKRGELREKCPAAQGGNHGLPRAPQWCCTGAAGAGQLTGCGADAVLAPHGPAAPGAAAPSGGTGGAAPPGPGDRLLPARSAGTAAAAPPGPGSGSSGAAAPLHGRQRGLQSPAALSGFSPPG